MIISKSLIWEETTLKENYSSCCFSQWNSHQKSLMQTSTRSRGKLIFALPVHHSPLDVSRSFAPPTCTTLCPVLWFLGSIQPQNAELSGKKQLPWNTNSPPSLPIFITDNRTRISWINPYPGPTNRAIQNPHKPRIHTFHMKKVSTIRQFPTKFSILKSLQANRTIPNRLLWPTITNTRQIKRWCLVRRKSMVVATAMTAVEGGGGD